MVLPIPFISWSDTSLTRSYFTSAYDFSRQFLHKWTVNWRFVSEDTFLSKEFKNTLLALHVSIVSRLRVFELTRIQVALLVIFALSRWLKSPTGGSSFGTIWKGLLHPLGPLFSPSSFPSHCTYLLPPSSSFTCDEVY
jgi:alpha-1,3-mannosyltransferase